MFGWAKRHFLCCLPCLVGSSGVVLVQMCVVSGEFKPGIPKVKCQHEGSYDSEGEKGKRKSAVELKVIWNEPLIVVSFFGLVIFCWKCLFFFISPPSSFFIKLYPNLVLLNRHVVWTLIPTCIAAKGHARMRSQMTIIVLSPSHHISNIYKSRDQPKCINKMILQTMLVSDWF